MAKGSNEKLIINKYFDENCKNNKDICRFGYKVHREYLALKGYWVFLTIYSIFGLFFIYKPFENGRDYFGSVIMFLLPVLADVINTKIYDRIIGYIKIGQIFILGVTTFISGLGLFEKCVIFQNNTVFLNKPFLNIQINIEIIWYIILITLISLVSNIYGAKSPLDQYFEDCFNISQQSIAV